MTDEPLYRLPSTVEPTHYDLTLTPDLDAATFAGVEEVAVTVHQPVTEIVLNAAELDIREAHLVSAGGAALVGAVTLDEENERATIALSGPAAPGTWTLRLSFTGTLNDKLRGFYRSTYKDDRGHLHTIATTQFEATDARRAFPCWDEPELKATFKVRLVVDRDLLAVSNAAVVSEQPVEGGKRRVEFDETMKMSTYLVAFVVGRLVTTDPVDVDGVPLRVVCVPGKERLAAFALEVGAHSLRFFARYFGIPYPSDKLDLIALPDFAMGAMENLGAVTFRESVLLVDEATSTQIEQERVADVIAHEIAHMWFGDLVTMKWWNGIWLNEAFATFMEMLCVDAFRPEWDRWTSFGVDRASAMVVDALGSTRPIEFPVKDPSEAEQMFDSLTYQKGAGVLRMLEQYLGAEAFREGIAAYIAKHSYGNTETTDLWDALEEATGEPVRATMDTWIYQGGHPLVSVESDGATLVVEQHRFRFRSDGEDASLWQVPIVLRAEGPDGTQHKKVLLAGERDTIRLDAPVSRVMLNDGGSGVYRTRYSADLMESLTADLGKLVPLERFTLVSDALATLQAGLTPVAQFIDLLRVVGTDEDDPSVWAAIIGALNWLERVTEPDDRGHVWSFAARLLRPAFERLGWSPRAGESERGRSLRANLISSLGTLGADEHVQTRAKELHASYLADRSTVDPDVAGALATVVAFSGDATDYAEFLRRWRTPATPQEELRYLYALGDFQRLDLLERSLGLVLTEVRSQNAPFLVSRCLGNRVGGERAWAWVKDNWDDIRQRFPENLIDRMLDGIATQSAPHQVADIRAFISTHPVPSRARPIEQLLERLEVASAFRVANQAALVAAFSR